MNGMTVQWKINLHLAMKRRSCLLEVREIKDQRAEWCRERTWGGQRGAQREQVLYYYIIPPIVSNR